MFLKGGGGLCHGQAGKAGRQVRMEQNNMLPEHEYRSLLLQAQKSAELIKAFLEHNFKSEPKAPSWNIELSFVTLGLSD